MDPLSAAERFINHTNQHVFLTGKAGTGKTTFLRNIVQQTHKKIIVTAPTGIAALNAGGVTLHSQFQLPLSGFLPTSKELFVQDNIKFETKQSLMRHMRMADVKRKTIREAEVIVIDEVSMLRADILDAIDHVLRSVRRNRNPYGGAQMLFIGDMLQLPPVVKNEEWQYLKEYYDSAFFFDAQVIKEAPPIYIELEKIYRQKDRFFTDILNNLRHNAVTEEDLRILNERYVPGFAPNKKEGYITLTTHNRIADEKNQQELQNLQTKSESYRAIVSHDFPESMYPCEIDLKLKIGAQIMFIKNDLNAAKRYFNGKIGWVESFHETTIGIRLENNGIIYAERYEWKNIRYSIDENTKSINEEILGTFLQFPIRLAWAITIHKSQGLTFEKAILDVRNVFASGQSYVALSRLTSLEGLVLTSPFSQKGIQPNEAITSFELSKEKQGDMDKIYSFSAIQYLEDFVLQTYNFKSFKNTLAAFLDSFNKSETHSEKQQYQHWSLEMAEQFYVIENVSNKFLSQLKELFKPSGLDLSYVTERLSAALNYFDSSLKDIISKIYLHKLEVRSQKRIKTYVTELEELDAMLMKHLAGMHKATLLAKSLLENQPLSLKDWEESFDLKWRYKLNFVEINSIQIPKKKEKGETYKLTYDFFKNGMSIVEIIQERKLTLSTIEGHFARLIEDGKLELEKVYPNKDFRDLINIILQIKNPSLSNIKKEVNDRYTYSEIKMALADIKQKKRLD